MIDQHFRSKNMSQWIRIHKEKSQIWNSANRATKSLTKEQNLSYYELLA